MEVSRAALHTGLLYREIFARAVSILILSLIHSCAEAQEIAPFRMTGIDGYVSTRFVQDHFSSGQDGSASGTANRSKQSQMDLRTDIFLMTHNYIYHPNFLTLDLGGGPVLQRQNYVADSTQTSGQSAMYNFSANAALLKDKPVSGNAFFEHLNPTMAVAPGDVITQASTRYGFDAGVTGALSPVPVRLGMTHSHVSGRSPNRLIDDALDQFHLNASRSWGNKGNTNFQYQFSQQNSSSGSLNLPIQNSTSETRGLSLDTRLQLGDDRQHDFTHLYSSNSQKYTVGGQAFPHQTDSLTFLDLRSRISTKLNTFTLANFTESTQGTLRSSTQILAAGLTYILDKNWESSLSARTEKNGNRDFSVHSQSLDGSLRGQRDWLGGILQGSYSLHYDQRNQQASAPTTQILGESVTLNGTTSVTLTHSHIEAGSIVVSNSSRTQIYVQNVDYQITVLGTQTMLQRLIGGSILDGEQVLVDYVYDTGGTFAYNQLDQVFNLNWGISRYLNIYFRQFASTPRLSSGNPAFPLSTVRSNLYGARGEIPFRLIVPMTVGGNVERENRSETISPYLREAEDVFIQTDDAFLGFANYRLSARRLRVTYDNALQNLDIKGWDFRSWSRPWFGVDVSLTTSYEQDDGGLMPRKRLDNSLNAQWRERKLTMNAAFVSSRETQGEFHRERKMFTLLMRRDF